MRKSQVIFVTAAILILVTMSVALVYYVKLTQHEETEKTIEILTVINYSSLKLTDNLEEYLINVTEGSTALEAFASVAELNFINHSFGVYIKGVNGYDEILPNFWAFYTYNIELSDWIYSPVGVSHYYLGEGDQIKLEYTE